MKDKTFAVQLTSSEWGKVCRALMTTPGNGELHRAIAAQLPHLSDAVLASFQE